MKVVKLLENKLVLQIFGVGLILSPFVNAWVSVLQLNIASADKWTWTVFAHVLLSGIPLQKILNVASIFIGFFLLSGSVKMWKFVLGLLGGYIVLQIIYLGQNLRANPVSGLLFLINVGLFVFIADQLVWKQRTPGVAKKKLPPLQEPAAPPVPATPLSRKARTVRTSAAKVMVHFKDFGPWGQLAAISTQGIEVKCLGKVPNDIESREIELRLGKQLMLRARFAHRHGSHYYFEYQGLAHDQQVLLSNWIQNKVA